MKLLDRNNKELQVVSQYLINDRFDTVYNISVDEFSTYHVGKLGTWVHNADCCDVNQVIDKINELTPVTPTSSGRINGKLMNEGGKVEYSSLSSTQQEIADDIMLNGDKPIPSQKILGGEKTEALTSSILEDGGYEELEGAKYAGNKGFDHVIKDGDDVVIILDSKQLAKSGSTKLGESNAGVQLSREAIEDVLLHLSDNSPAKVAINNALENGHLKTAVIGVDKNTGNVLFTPFTVKPKN